MRKRMVIFAAFAALMAAGVCHATSLTYGKGYRFDKNGWIYVHIEGRPYQRGYQYGYLIADRLAQALRTTRFMTYWNTGKKWEFFRRWAVKLFAKKIPPEYMKEMKGIADGARARGLKVTWKDILLWNGYFELVYYWWPLQKEGKFFNMPKTRCSAFIATGEFTKDGKIVMAHNSWCNFVMCQYLNVIVDLKPERGYRILMQSMPGYIYSMSDFFVTSAGIVGTETTIGGFNVYNPRGTPEFVRIRRAMQYGRSLDDYVRIMVRDNTGGYANDWLFGDVNTGEIMRLELGLKYHRVWRTKSGYYIGFNAPLDPRIRNLECSNTGYADIRRHQGARQVRLTQLMRQYKGRIDIKTAERILADHYDVYLKRENPSSRTVDGHYELDNRAFMSQPGRPLPYQPRGTVDGKVVDSQLAKRMSFVARWGNSSGMPFYADKFLKEHIQWEHLKGYLEDRPTQPWTLFKVSDKP